MNDEQLLEHSPEEARQKLSDEQLERYNELQKNNLQEGIEDKKKEDAENAVNGLEAMRQQAEGDLTVSVYGIEFVADVNPAQVKKLKELEKFEDKSPEQLNDKEFEKVHNDFTELLNDLSTDYDLTDWHETFGDGTKRDDAGIMTMAQIIGQLLSKIDVKVDQKKSR